MELSSHSFSRTFAKIPNENETRAPNHHFAFRDNCHSQCAIYISIMRAKALLRLLIQYVYQRNNTELTNITHMASKMEQFRCDLGRVFSFQNVFHTLNPFLRFVISFSVALKNSNISHTVVSVFFLVIWYQRTSTFLKGADGNIFPKIYEVSSCTQKNIKY